MITAKTTAEEPTFRHDSGVMVVPCAVMVKGVNFFGSDTMGVSI